MNTDVTAWLYMQAHARVPGKGTNRYAVRACARAPPYAQRLAYAIKDASLQGLVKQSVLDACSMQNLKIRESRLRRTMGTRVDSSIGARLPRWPWLSVGTTEPLRRAPRAEPRSWRPSVQWQGPQEAG